VGQEQQQSLPVEEAAVGGAQVKKRTICLMLHLGSTAGFKNHLLLLSAVAMAKKIRAKTALKWGKVHHHHQPDGDPSVTFFGTEKGFSLKGQQERAPLLMVKGAGSTKKVKTTTATRRTRPPTYSPTDSAARTVSAATATATAAAASKATAADYTRWPLLHQSLARLLHSPCSLL
jgi:hypothetical protein